MRKSYATCAQIVVYLVVGLGLQLVYEDYIYSFLADSFYMAYEDL